MIDIKININNINKFLKNLLKNKIIYYFNNINS